MYSKQLNLDSYTFSLIFDNVLTLPFAFFMSVWGKQFRNMFREGLKADKGQEFCMSSFGVAATSTWYLSGIHPDFLERSSRGHDGMERCKEPIL